jgi:hypothetical protein
LCKALENYPTESRVKLACCGCLPPNFTKHFPRFIGVRRKQVINGKRVPNEFETRALSHLETFCININRKMKYLQIEFVFFSENPEFFFHRIIGWKGFVDTAAGYFSATIG